MLKKIERILYVYNRWGWKAFYCIFFPVHWTQDSSFVNNGYDILTIKDTTKRSYFTGRDRNNPFWHIW